MQGADDKIEQATNAKGLQDQLMFIMGMHGQHARSSSSSGCSGGSGSAKHAPMQQGTTGPKAVQFLQNMHWCRVAKVQGGIAGPG